MLIEVMAAFLVPLFIGCFFGYIVGHRDGLNVKDQSLRRRQRAQDILNYAIANVPGHLKKEVLWVHDWIEKGAR